MKLQTFNEDIYIVDENDNKIAKIEGIEAFNMTISYNTYLQAHLTLHCSPPEDTEVEEYLGDQY